MVLYKFLLEEEQWPWNNEHIANGKPFLVELSSRATEETLSTNCQTLEPSELVELGQTKLCTRKSERSQGYSWAETW